MTTVQDKPWYPASTQVMAPTSNGDKNQFQNKHIHREDFKFVRLFFPAAVEIR